MSNVTLTIGGRSFVVACAEGEEAHVTALGRMIDGKLATMGDTSGQNEARMLLFASLLLADELHELQRNADRVQSTDHSPVSAPGLSEKLAFIAERLENLAEQLEGAAASA